MPPGHSLGIQKKDFENTDQILIEIVMFCSSTGGNIDRLSWIILIS